MGKELKIPKKPYKRSEWMEGMLWAENVLRYYTQPSDHLFVVDTDGMDMYEILGRGMLRDKPHKMRTVSREFGKGVIDYIEHKENMSISDGK